MELTKSIITFTLLSILISLTTSSSVVDFCVADLRFPKGSAGYLCRDPANVTVDDFIFTDFRVAKNTSTNIFKSARTLAIDTTFPGLNGLGLSMARVDIGVGGVIPTHTHRASEIILVVEGTVSSGFIASDNTTYRKTLNKGDIMILPPSLLHFQANVGDVPVIIFQTHGSANAGTQIARTKFTANGLPADVILHN